LILDVVVPQLLADIEQEFAFDLKLLGQDVNAHLLWQAAFLMGYYT
jgi:hypothetical protein